MLASIDIFSMRWLYLQSKQTLYNNCCFTNERHKNKITGKKANKKKTTTQNAIEKVFAHIFCIVPLKLDRHISHGEMCALLFVWLLSH